MHCPVCNGNNFDTYGRRENARCTTCGALERGRLSWMVLQRLNLLRPGVRMLNMAPETFMLFHAARVLGQTYVATDYDPSLFAKWNKPVARLDLCSGLAALPPGAFDVVMHNHVLEHLPCGVVGVLSGINRLLAPGGLHLFSVPIVAGCATDEDLNPALTPEDRRERFGQGDHLRIFGDHDFLEIIASAMPLDRMIDLSLLIRPEELLRAAIPPDIFHSLNSHRVFAWRQEATSTGDRAGSLDARAATTCSVAEQIIQSVGRDSDSR